MFSQNWFELAQRFHRSVGAGMLIGVDQLLASAGAHRNRNDLLGQNAILLRRHRPLVRRHREFVLLVSRDAVLPPKIFRRLQHPAGHRVMTTTGGGPSAREPVVHPHTTAGTAPAHVGGVEGDVAHALRAARDDDIAVACAHLQTRLDHRLQARPTAPVDLHTGNRHGQTGVQCDDPTDRRRLAARVAMTEDDILHQFAWDAGPFEQPGQSRNAEVDGGLRLEHPAVAADRRPNRFADHGFTRAHRCLPPVTSRTAPAIYDDRSLARNSATLATSSGSPARPIGISASFSSQIRCGMASVIADLISPGWIALTRTPRWASSLAAALVMPTIPALAAE